MLRCFLLVNLLIGFMKSDARYLAIKFLFPSIFFKSLDKRDDRDSRVKMTCFAGQLFV